MQSLWHSQLLRVLGMLYRIDNLHTILIFTILILLGSFLKII